MLPAGYTATRAGIWLSITASDSSPTGLQQGWKLHVSARPGSLLATLTRAMPVLLEEACNFKLIANADFLRELNSGVYGAGAVGKAITVYPHQDRVVTFAYRLAEALKGFEGPRVNSDRQLRADAPVYYRYGPISPRFRMSDMGDVDVIVEAPDGGVTSGSAAGSYWSPGWAKDPFFAEPCGTPVSKIPGASVIGDHYRVVGGITRTHRGSRYRAVDLRTGDQVVIKEARAFVEETAEGDVRAYLRHERRVLAALEGIAGVPRVVDHFAYGNDEFLVTTDLGSSNLRSNVIDDGVFATEPNAQRNVFYLARALLRMLDDIHERGVVNRDLAPKNVVALPAGGWGLVDFELSSLNGRQRYGWTAGYSDTRQRNHERAAVEDDYFSLGATLFYAVTGLDPIVIDDEPGVNVARTVACLAAACGANAAITELITDLLDLDALVRSNAVRALRAATMQEPRRAASAPPFPLPEAVLRHTLNTVLQHARALSAHDFQKVLIPPPATPYSGTAGVVMELSQHSAALSTANELARLTAHVINAIDAPPGLLFGRMGTALALRAVAHASHDDELDGAAGATVPSDNDVAGEQRVDIAHGLAGIGLGYLALAAAAPDPSRYDTLAGQCAARLRNADIDVQLEALPTGKPAHGVSVADGFAHGRAGIAYFLMAHAARSGNDESRRRARELIEATADSIADLSMRAASGQGRPMSASWCQGLAGMGSTLVRAALFFDDERLLAAARTAAIGCRAIAARVPLVTQCCGLAGIGEFLLDLADVAGDSRHRQEALEILGLILARSGGSPTAPRFPDNTMRAESPGWATGTAGVLSFLRRLVDPSSTRLWMADSPEFFPLRRH